MHDYRWFGTGVLGLTNIRYTGSPFEGFANACLWQSNRASTSYEAFWWISGLVNIGSKNIPTYRLCFFFVDLTTDTRLNLRFGTTRSCGIILFFNRTILVKFKWSLMTLLHQSERNESSLRIETLPVVEFCVGLQQLYQKEWNRIRGTVSMDQLVTLSRKLSIGFL